jgi:hypothetical protein
MLKIGTLQTYEAPSKTQSHISSGGKHNLRGDHDLQAKFASLTRKVEALELKKSSQLKSVQDIVSNLWNQWTLNQWLSNLPSFKECLHEQAHDLNSFQRPNHNPYSQTYNPGWRNHPNFSWKSEHKLQSHRFKHIIISKILMDMHLFMLHLLEEILRKHCMHSLTSKRQSTLILLKAWQILKISFQ